PHAVRVALPLRALPPRRSSDLVTGAAGARPVKRMRCSLPGAPSKETVNDSGVTEVRVTDSAPEVSSPGASNGKVTVTSMRLGNRSEEHTSELQSRFDLVGRLLL